MSLSKENVQKAMDPFRRDEKDSGSSEVQVALFTERIKELTEHLKIHKKDVHSKRGLQMMVNKRNKLLKYIYGKSHRKYSELVAKLGIRAKLTRS